MAMVSNFISQSFRVSARPTRFQREIKLIICFSVWIDSVAIYVAVIVVTGVGSIVDYLKEQEFTKRTREENANYKVSLPSHLIQSLGPRH